MIDRMKTTKRILFLAVLSVALLGTLAAQESPPPTNPGFRRSLDFDLLASWSYKQTLGLDTAIAKFSYVPMLTYSFILNETNTLGIVLVKFDHFPLADNPVYSFAYGFQFKHYWNRKWADLGAFVPWLSYGILLNQALVTNTAGRAIGHNTRMAMGTDIILASAHRLTPQLAWDSVDFPTLGSGTSNSLSSLSLGLGYRFLF